MPSNSPREGGDGVLPRSGHVYRQLIRDCVEGKKTRKELGAQFGVTHDAIHMFMKRHAREIDAVRGHPEDAFHGMWISDKEMRIAELQELAEILGEAIERVPDPDMIRAKAALLKQVSEELGQLPPRQQIVSARVSHVIEGISDDTLQSALT